MADSQQNNQPHLCINNCGFFGNPSFDNYCSKCFKLKNPSPPVAVKQQQQQQSMVEPPPLADIQAASNVITSAAASAASVSISSSAEATAVANAVVAQAITDAFAKDSTVTATTTTAAVGQEQSSAAAVPAGEEQQPEELSAVRPVQQRKDRCFKCNSKINIAKQITNKCRCEYIYCDSHRSPDHHDCDFDHMQLQKELLAKRVPKLLDRKSGGRSFTRID